MAGHNKWSKIKHRKAVVDKRRGKVWTKVAKTIIVAARNGGPDPASNLALRYAIDEARYANMPRDTIERAIRKGAGGEDTSTYESVRYEGYGPGAAAIIVDALTDNRTRTVTDVRLAFGTHGGNLGATGCVGYLFQTLGRVVIGTEDDALLNGDRLMEVAANAGASDIEAPETSGDCWIVLADPQAFPRVKEAIEGDGFPIREAGIAMVPSTRVVARGQIAKDLISLVESLEELDDVQKVYANFDIPESELASLGQ